MHARPHEKIAWEATTIAETVCCKEITPLASDGNLNESSRASRAHPSNRKRWRATALTLASSTSDLWMFLCQLNPMSHVLVVVLLSLTEKQLRVDLRVHDNNSDLGILSTPNR